MVSITITLTGTKEIPVDEYETGSSCPVPTQDSAVNAKNKQGAVEDADYRDPPESSAELCGNCGAYNQTSEILDCLKDDSGDLGYCQIYKFVCTSDHVCDDWVKGGPITSLEQEDFRETF
jgi:hypothetical protein